MATKHYITVSKPSDGSIVTGLTVQLLWGSNPINGQLANTYIDDYTENPSPSGAYEIDITETNMYSILVNGEPQDELTDIWICSNDVATYVTLSSTATGEGAALIAIEDSAGLLSATTVEGALAELAGAGRTSETVKGNATSIAAIQAVLGSVSNAELLTLTSAGDAGAEHHHDNQYYTEAELGTTGIPTLVLGTAASGGDGQIITPASNGGTPCDLILRPGTVSGTQARGAITFDTHATGAETDGGDITFDTRPTTGNNRGIVSIYREDGYYEITTAYELGDLDFTGSNYLNILDPADAGMVTRGMRELDARVGLLSSQVEGTVSRWKVAWTNPKLTAVGAVGGDIAALAYWTVADTFDYDFIRLTLPVTEVPMARIRIWVYGKVSAGNGIVTATMGTNTASATITAVSDELVTVDLVPDVSYSGPVTIVIGCKSIGGTSSIREDICIGYY